MKASVSTSNEAIIQASIEASHEVKVDIGEQVGPNESSVQKLGSEVLSISGHDPSDTFTYKEVLELTRDPKEIRAVPGRKSSLL
jgi:hypothetical protein